MTDSSPFSTAGLPDWVAPHVPGFREVLRTLTMATGFTLLPVEISGPDVARALAQWLEAKGQAPLVIEPIDDAGWQRIVADLFATEPAAARVVAVVGDRQPPQGVYAGLRLLNQRRDTLAQHLACPLLWCGPAEFMKLTWERAPDFWSVRALTLHLDVPRVGGSERPMWPGLAVSDSPERLRDAMDAAAAQKDALNAARVGDLLAEALVARSELEEAAEVVAEVERLGAAPPTLLLTKGILLAQRGDALGAKAAFDLAASGERKPSDEARRLSSLGNLLLFQDRESARRDYEAALARARESEDRVTEGVALANLAVVGMHDGAYDDAKERLEAALAIFRSIDDTRNEARVLAKLGSVHLSQRDSRRACEFLEEALAGFRGLGDRHGEAETLLRLARAYLDMADPEKARDDAARAVTMAREVGDSAGAREAEEVLERARREMRG